MHICDDCLKDLYLSETSPHRQYSSCNSCKKFSICNVIPSEHLKLKNDYSLLWTDIEYTYEVIVRTIIEDLANRQEFMEVWNSLSEHKKLELKSLWEDKVKQVIGTQSNNYEGELI